MWRCRPGGVKVGLDEIYTQYTTATQMERPPNPDLIGTVGFVFAFDAALCFGSTAAEMIPYARR